MAGTAHAGGRPGPGLLDPTTTERPPRERGAPPDSHGSAGPEPPRPGEPGRRDPGGHGGSGGDGWSWDGWREPDPDGGPPPERVPPDVASFALALLLIGLTTLFVVVLSVWALLRRDAPEWPPPGSPGPPTSLWLSTLAIVVSSTTLERAVRVTRAARHGRATRTATRWLTASLALGLAFLGLQVHAWRELVGAGLLPSTNGFGASFYALTSLHALHVLVGVAAVGLLWRRPRAPLVRYRVCATYWHFVGAVWGVLFTAIYVLR